MILELYKKTKPQLIFCANCKEFLGDIDVLPHTETGPKCLAQNYFSDRDVDLIKSET